MRPPYAPVRVFYFLPPLPPSSYFPVPSATYYPGFSLVLKAEGGANLWQPWPWVQIPLLSSTELWTRCVRGNPLRQPVPLVFPRQGLQVAWTGLETPIVCEVGLELSVILYWPLQC